MSSATILRSKRALLGLLLALLVLPAIQARFPLLQDQQLGGYVAADPDNQDPALTWPTVLDNSYQPRLERYATRHAGFRGWLIQFRNQLAYSLLHTAHAQGIIVGRDEVLYETGAVRDYLGQTAVPASVVERHVRRFRSVQDSLARRGTLLVYVAVPSKASFMPENLPAYFRRQPRRPSNYEAYTAAMWAAGVNLLDLSRAFHQWKDTSRYPLFPRGGTHWSTYGSRLAGDTLLRYLQRHYAHPLPQYHVRQGEVSQSVQGVDDDLVRTINLLWSPKPYLAHFPQVVAARPQPGECRPNLLLIGDSYCWTLMYPYLVGSFEQPSMRFWYYTSEINGPPDLPEGKDVWAPSLNRRQQYLNRDIIIVLYSEYNMATLDGGFSDDAYKVFHPYTHADSARIQALEVEIGQTPNLADKWWDKSRDTGLTFSQLVHAAAVARFDSLSY